MITDALARRAQKLVAQGASFVTATVVRAQRPTSVQAGNVALITSDGKIEGFVGGVCAEHSVRLYSLKVLESGEPVLLKILPPDGAKGEEGAGEELPTDLEGSVTVANPCLSGGAIEVFLEPVLPQPRILVVGSTPIAGAILRIAPELGLKVEHILDGVLHPLPGDLGLVVAAHGRDELETVRQGLEAKLPYVGLVASPKRAAGLVKELVADGMTEQQLAQVEAPAGIAIAAHTPAEIALSILARLVTVRRGGAYKPAPAAGTPAAAPATALDPICGMTVTVKDDTPRVEHDGETVYFCCSGCKAAFEERHGLAAPDEAPAAGGSPLIAVDPVCGMTVMVDERTPRTEHGGETHYFCRPGCKTTFEKEHVHAAAAK